MRSLRARRNSGESVWDMEDQDTIGENDTIAFRDKSRFSASASLGVGMTRNYGIYLSSNSTISAGVVPSFVRV